MTKYTFIAEDKETNETTCMMLESNTSTWAAPMELFFRFLKAQGYVFNEHNDYIGVMNIETETFRGPNDALELV